MHLDDVDLHAFLLEERPRDVGVLGRDAQHAQTLVVLLGQATALLGLGHDEAAIAELEVDELHDRQPRLDERVLAADAAVGTTVGDEHRRIRGSHDDEVDARIRDDEASARIGKARGIQACLSEQLNGIAKE